MKYPNHNWERIRRYDAELRRNRRVRGRIRLELAEYNYRKSRAFIERVKEGEEERVKEGEEESRQKSLEKRVEKNRKRDNTMFAGTAIFAVAGFLWVAVSACQDHITPPIKADCPSESTR